MNTLRPAGESGFAMLEVIAASTFLLVGIISLAQLLVIATRSNHAAAQATKTATLAAQKLELLRDGALSPSPASSLNQDVAGYQERLDRFGAITSDASNWAYLRRWRITASTEGPPNAFVIEVFVAPIEGSAAPMASYDQGAASLLGTLRIGHPE